MFKDKKVIIFDMDGTLIDSVGIWNEVDRVLIGRLRADGEAVGEDVQKQRDAVLRKFNASESPYMDYCRFLKEKYKSDLSTEEVYTLRHDIAEDFLRNVIDYKKDADVLIKELKKRGFILIIATTTRRNNMATYRTLNKKMMEKARIDDFFSRVYTIEDAKEVKPNPEIYFRLMDEFHVKPKECLIFEDSLVGIEAAKNAGIESAAMYDKYSDTDREEINRLSDYQFDSFSDVLRVLRSELRP